MNKNVRKKGNAVRKAGVKKENPDEEIKEYVETTMNEMLGWYGYDKMNSKDCSLHSVNLMKLKNKYRSRSGSTEPDTSSDEYVSPRSPSTLSSSPVEQITTCGWCDKAIAAKAFTFRTAEPNIEKVFCSEQCFSQYRRANFKRNKTCDWCRHLRHTVNCVDFQDGDHQLQFCSDKCLNQYKMNIFCKETQAQLELHPHLQNTSLPESVCKSLEPNLPLITPDLWLRDCQSPSDRSPSPRKSSPAEPPQLRVSNKLFDRPSRKRKRLLNTEEVRTPQPGYNQCQSRVPVYCTPPLCRSPVFTQSQPTSSNTSSSEQQAPPQPPPPSIYPMTMPQSILPPPMILVPYPIMLPIPIPIPIPIPLPYFHKETDSTTKEVKDEK
ncbi:sine oculis-binding protein homolog B [Adelges cooleyi]|uniref:sine oculis-binding protein homolog B n=1 Tax=Adelges cooleyi TaxID=133065 RepID=UPI00217F7797|nr:sine oculis-binding protein homolog B [Adelges cooleyi]XP_050428522.1 sine oculis-binding protein homolog B [Adelges cooleyi]